MALGFLQALHQLTSPVAREAAILPTIHNVHFAMLIRLDCDWLVSTRSRHLLSSTTGCLWQIAGAHGLAMRVNNGPSPAVRQDELDAENLSFMPSSFDGWSNQHAVRESTTVVCLPSPNKCPLVGQFRVAEFDIENHVKVGAAANAPLIGCHGATPRLMNRTVMLSAPNDLGNGCIPSQ